MAPWPTELVRLPVPVRAGQVSAVLAACGVAARAAGAGEVYVTVPGVGDAVVDTGGDPRGDGLRVYAGSADVGGQLALDVVADILAGVFHGARGRRPRRLSR